ncbi:MAG: hypothetical protein U1F36_17025 [Planctomycetota bacterium]
MATKKTRQDLEAELRVLRAARTSDRVCTTISCCFKYSCFAYLGWCALESVRALAGRTTLSQFFVGILGNIELGWTVSLTVGLVGIIYGSKERALRRRVVVQLAAQKTDLEKRLDPGRTSSSLTIDGMTNPKDKR